MTGKYRVHSGYIAIESIFIDSIPAHWEIKPLHSLCEFRQGKAHEQFVDDDGDFICVNARFVSTQGKSAKRCTVNLTPANIYDILMVMSDLPNGRALAKAFFVSEPNNYAVNQRVCAITSQNVEAKFLYYQLDRSPYFLMFDDGSNQTHLSNDAYRKYPVLLPPKSEQMAIASFLDHETGIIDSLIEKQQQLILLLNEKRQALISHAVTKGLNPNAKLKYSSLEWLDEMPNTWDSGRLTYQLELLVDGTHHSPESYPTGDFLYVTAKNIKENGFDFSNITYISAIDHEVIYSRCPVKKDDILYIKDGATAGIAMVNDLENEFSLLSSVALIRPKSNILLPKYLMFQLNAMVFKNEMLNRLNGGAMTRFTIDGISRFNVVIPPISEQNEIIIFIEKKISKMNILIEKAENAIKFIQERRTALISAAVTGKIDLRSWQPPKDYLIDREEIA